MTLDTSARAFAPRTIAIDWPNRDERRAMNPIRRSVWMAVILGASVGCNSDETTSTTGTPTTPSPSLAPAKPVVPSATKGEDSKEGASKEMPPMPATPAETKKGDELPKIEGPKTEGTGKGEAAAVKLTPDEIAAIKQLPAADQGLALKQAVCPVSDEHLGAMDKPQKTSVEGRTVFLCCDNCEKELKADPKKFLAKLDAQAGKK
jgi:YHS domain-containing protein